MQEQSALTARFKLPLIKNGKTLVSGIDPENRAGKIVDAFPLKDRTLYLCPSPVYGFGLPRLLSRIKDEAPLSAVLCVESDYELFELSLNYISPSILENKKFHMAHVFDSSQLTSLVRSVWGARAFRRVETIRLTGGWQLTPLLYDSLRTDLEREIANDWSNALTLYKLGRLYIRNAMRNLEYLSRFFFIDDLSFGDDNILVLGAGPSLDEILDMLKMNSSMSVCNPQERPFKIICVDTCLGALKDRNIIPDLAVILESQHWNLRDFIGCQGWNIPFAADLSALPSSLDLLAGTGYFFMTPWTELKVFGRLREKELLPAEIPPLGSVGLTAAEIARRLSRGIILCAGIDFSFTADKYHARGTPGHKNNLNLNTRLRSTANTAAFGEFSFSAISKTGLPVYSSPIMRNYNNLFKQEFGGDSRIYDIEGSGLSLGVKTLSMREAAALLNSGKFSRRPAHAQSKGCKKEYNYFLECEIRRLHELRDILSGGRCLNGDRLSVLIDECDYLWAHFPDYSGGRTQDVSDISFLKRVRAELDPMIKLIEQTMKRI